jgi:hypothetical protein
MAALCGGITQPKDPPPASEAFRMRGFERFMLEFETRCRAELRSSKKRNVRRV